MKNLISAEFVEELKLPTKPHPSPYNLDWVTKNGPTNWVDKTCKITFVMYQFINTITCDVSFMDCCDLLLGKPYQFDRQTTYEIVLKT